MECRCRKEHSPLQIQKSSTLTRTITGVILVLVFGACVALGRYTSVAFFAAFGCIACVELANALHVMKIRSSPWPACILLVLICAALLLKLPSAWSIIALAVMVLAVLMYALFFKVEYENVLGTLSIILYPMLSFLLFAYVGEMELNHRVPILSVVAFAANLCDIGAYFIGRWVGKHKLAPEISPKKTIEGSVGGMIVGTLSGILLYFVLKPIVELPLALYLVSCFLCSAAGEIGDLCASMIKRQANIKDYGKLLPGHGGVMDRFDSMAFALPIALLSFELYFVLLEGPIA